MSATRILASVASLVPRPLRTRRPGFPVAGSRRTGCRKMTDHPSRPWDLLRLAVYARSAIAASVVLRLFRTGWLPRYPRYKIKSSGFSTTIEQRNGDYFRYMTDIWYDYAEFVLEDTMPRNEEQVADILIGLYRTPFGGKEKGKYRFSRRALLIISERGALREAFLDELKAVLLERDFFLLDLRNTTA